MSTFWENWVLISCFMRYFQYYFTNIIFHKSWNTALSDMHSIEKLKLIHNLLFFNYRLVHITRILTFDQNKLLSKKSIFSRSTLYFQIIHYLSCRKFYAYHFKTSNFKKQFKIRLSNDFYDFLLILRIKLQKK